MFCFLQVISFVFEQNSAPKQITELKQETKREERDVENTLGLRTDQYNKKLTLVSKITHFLNLIFPNRKQQREMYQTLCQYKLFQESDGID